MQKTNLITQLILEIKLTHFLSSLFACPGMPDHTYLKQSTNICMVSALPPHYNGGFNLKNLPEFCGGNFFFLDLWRNKSLWELKTIWSDGLVTKAVDFQSRGPVFKTTGWLQGRLSLSSFRS